MIVVASINNKTMEVLDKAYCDVGFDAITNMLSLSLKEHKDLAVCTDSEYAVRAIGVWETK